MSSTAKPFIQVAVSFNGVPVNTQVFGQKEVLIGRGSDCDVHLDNPGASRQHARILRDGDTLTIEDLGSGNGTFISGKQISRTTLRLGDVISISKFSITARLVDDNAAPSDTTGASAKVAIDMGEGDGNTVFLRPQERARVAEQTESTRPKVIITADPNPKAPAIPRVVLWVLGGIAALVIASLVLR